MHSLFIDGVLQFCFMLGVVLEVLLICRSFDISSLDSSITKNYGAAAIAGR